MAKPTPADVLLILARCVAETPADHPDAKELHEKARKLRAAALSISTPEPSNP